MQTSARDASVVYQGVRKDSAGYKLLMSMGWKEGQGLGIDGSGIKKHIRARARLGKQGIGVDEALTKRQKLWEGNTHRFEAVLKNLTEVRSNARVSPQKVTKKSKKKEKSEKGSHAGRYVKQKRAKLVKSYSEADLAAILGQDPENKQTNIAASSSSDDHTSESAMLDHADAFDAPMVLFSYVSMDKVQKKRTSSQRLQSILPLKCYSEKVSTEIYDRLHSTASTAKQGLGRRRKHGKIGGGIVNQGRRMLFDEEDSEDREPKTNALEEGMESKEIKKTKKNKATKRKRSAL